MSVKFTTIKIPSANLGDVNPTVDINNVSYIHAGYKMSESAQNKKPPFMGEGMVSTMLPYLQQDGYDRKLEDKELAAVVLENENLIATVLTGLGGRLYSLFDKKRNRELLYVNEIFQPANLSLRNAWFSGGVEWNVAIKGHNPFTCSPMFVSKTESSLGEGVKLYEYERKRNIVYSIDFILPKNSEFLYVIPTIENTENAEKYAYWWSNIAVKETPRTRVIVPASKSYMSSYNKNAYFVDYVDNPIIEGRDSSYPLTAPRSNDYFYDIDNGEEKWITAVDEQGKGLLQLSTNVLYGRKLFVWGQGNGGKNWQDFLSGGRGSYIEIQAGLAHTQLQHIKMPASTKWRWCEAYGAIDIDANKAHDENYKIAVKAVKDYISEYFPKGVNITLQQIADDYNETTLPPKRLGSGWGALKNTENQLLGVEPISKSLDFPAQSINEDQELFYELLNSGEVHEIDVKAFPKGYVISEYFEKKFAEAIANGCENWNTYYHLGVIKYALGKVEESQKAWEKSVEIKPSCWAYRNLAMLERNVYHNMEKAVELMQKSVYLNPVLPIEKDYGETLVKAGLYEKWIEYFDGDCKNKDSERLQFYKAFALTKLKKYQEASKIVNENYTLSDIKEGELSVSELWYEIYGPIITGRDDIDEKERNAIVDKLRPLGKLDFRMH